MDAIELRPQEESERGEGMESTAMRALDEATFEPAAFVEQSGNYQQAEAVQSGLETVMATISEATVAGGEFGDKFDTKEPGGVAEIPLPGTAGETSSGTEQVGTLPTPTPRPEGTVSMDPDPVVHEAYKAAGEADEPSFPKNPAGSVEVPLPGTAAAKVAMDGSSKDPAFVKEPSYMDEDLGNKLGEDLGLKYDTSFPKNPTRSVEVPLPGTAADEVAMDGSSKDPAYVKEPFQGLDGKIPFRPAEVPLPGSSVESSAVEEVIVRTTAAMQEMQMSFNLQYLMLQNKISHENRQYSMQSNILKDNHDTAKNSINNIR